MSLVRNWEEGWVVNRYAPMGKSNADSPGSSTKRGTMNKVDNTGGMQDIRYFLRTV